MTRTRSLALGRLDGTEPIVVIRPADIGRILEALRYSGEAAAENGGSAAAERRLIDRIARLAHTDPALYHVPEPDLHDWTLIVEETSATAEPLPAERPDGYLDRRPA